MTTETTDVGLLVALRAWARQGRDDFGELFLHLPGERVGRRVR